MTTATDATAPDGIIYDPVALGIARGLKVADVARENQLSERTVQRRLKCPEFMAQVRELRGKMIGEAAGMLADAMTAASAVLKALLDSPDEDVRFKAAVRIIELSLRVREQHDLSERLAALEALMSKGK